MFNPQNKNNNRRPQRPIETTTKEYEEKVIQLKRTSKKTKGGNKIGFSALVLIGNKKGKIGTGLGKASDVSGAVQKGLTIARRNLVEINIKGNTIAYEVDEKYGSAKVLMKPAPEGTGIVAGGAVRNVVELAGIKDISAKMLGSSNKSCNLICAIECLEKLRA